MADGGRFYMVSRHIGLEASASKLPIYVASLPNPGLISHLISNYYQKYADAEASELVSYHWKHHSEQFDVRFDFQGSLIPRSGCGVCRQRGISRRILDQLCVLSHLTHLVTVERLVGC